MIGWMYGGKGSGGESKEEGGRIQGSLFFVFIIHFFSVGGERKGMGGREGRVSCTSTDGSSMLMPRYLHHPHPVRASSEAEETTRESPC